MIRLFHVYYPVRTLVLFLGEALVICCSFLMAALIRFGPDSYIVLNYESGVYKIVGVTVVALLGSYYVDLYDPERLTSQYEMYFRVLVVLGGLSFLLAAINYFLPEIFLGRGVALTGIVILTLMLLGWRSIYGWLLTQTILQEQVYILGAGERARVLTAGLRERRDLGMNVIGFAEEAIGGTPSREQYSEHLHEIVQAHRVDRVIIALSDRRGVLSVTDLLQFRVNGIAVEDATALLEKVSGKIDVDQINPSFLIYSQGFRVRARSLLLRRIVSVVSSLIGLVLVLPILPLIALAIRFSSPGPIIYRQERVGYKGKPFYCYKFRTMRADAEANTGPTWAKGNDPRVTPLGRFLRKTRLDEVPQLWNVLKGDMNLVGPRPERPEFVAWLNEAIPYYQLRHMVAPGLTGWAQIRYRYGSSLEDTKEKLRYDLYYIKHMSISLDLLIAFETVKTVLCRRGAQ